MFEAGTRGSDPMNRTQGAKRPVDSTGASDLPMVGCFVSPTALFVGAL
jgi:hypothetical protein